MSVLQTAGAAACSHLATVFSSHPAEERWIDNKEVNPTRRCTSLTWSGFLP